MILARHSKPIIVVCGCLLLVGSVGAFQANPSYNRRLAPHLPSTSCRAITHTSTSRLVSSSPFVAAVKNKPALTPPTAFPSSRERLVGHALYAVESSKENKASDSSSASPPPFAFLVGLVGAVMHLVFCSILGNNNKYHGLLQTISRVMLSAFMLGGAAMRCDQKTVNDLLIPMVPPPLPAKLCVYASGVVEATCAALLLIPRWSIVGAQLTVALLLGVYPANIYHAVSKKAQREIQVVAPQWLLNARLVIQLLFIYWAAWFVPKWW